MKKQVLAFGKYITFVVLSTINVLNLFYFWLRSWRIRAVMNYHDGDYKDYLDTRELFIGYVSGWTVIFILAFIYSLLYIRRRPIMAVLWQLLPILYIVCFLIYQSLR